ncbi:formate dehydrogenase subunit gamma [Pistricoccus aurantiacus]|uniref:formate dehydrogenase subunit gamma n=1 Tax=Pistricoccus aurantiacus TaxID=1883414 RepID=UPI00363F798C
MTSRLSYNLAARWLAAFLAMACILLSLGMSHALGADPQAEIETALSGVDERTWEQVATNEGARDTRYDSNYSLINASGETWRQIRNRWVSTFGVIAIVGMALMILGFYLYFGSKKLEEPRTGRRLLRWTVFERTLHWSTATTFILLALTGLNLMYGKFVFKPLFGDGFWAPMIAGTKLLHNYLGPLFGILLIIILAKWLKVNLPRAHDLEWFKKGGGLIGKGHVDAGFANAGEKAWYWLLASAGLLVIISGLVLDFPIFGQTRDGMQWANVIHAVGALGLTAVALGHIYIGTVGTEGSLEAMTTGYVDETWAKEHHNLWYDEVKEHTTLPEHVDKGSFDEAASHRPN